MALAAGDNTCPADTMAKAIYDALNTELGSVTGDYDADRKKIAAAIAKGVVDHIVALADVQITDGDGALQRDPQDPYTDTLAPSATRTLESCVV